MHVIYIGVEVSKALSRMTPRDSKNPLAPNHSLWTIVLLIFKLIDKIFDLIKDTIRLRITDIPRTNDEFMPSNCKSRKIKRMPTDSLKSK